MEELGWRSVVYHPGNGLYYVNLPKYAVKKLGISLKDFVKVDKCGNKLYIYKVSQPRRRRYKTNVKKVTRIRKSLYVSIPSEFVKEMPKDVLVGVEGDKIVVWW